jgi:hypothetical protein
MSPRSKIALGSLAGALIIHATLFACTSSNPGGPMARIMDSSMREANAQADATGEGGPTIEAGTVSTTTIGNTLEVATEDCSHTLTDGAGTTYHYAVHAYPGFNAGRLSQVRTMGHIANAGVSPLGYAWGIPRDQQNKWNSVFVNDSSVAVICGTQTGTTPLIAWYDSVVFSLVD